MRTLVELIQKVAIQKKAQANIIATIRSETSMINNTISNGMIQAFGLVAAIIVCSFGRNDLCNKIFKVERISWMVVAGGVWYLSLHAIAYSATVSTGDLEVFYDIYSVSTLGIIFLCPALLYSWSVFFGKNKDIRFPWRNNLFHAAFLVTSALFNIIVKFCSGEVYICLIILAVMLHGANIVSIRKHLRSNPELREV